MITKEQALNAHEFHAQGGCKIVVGSRGGRQIRREIWRRNGQTKLWKTRPDEFRIPVKYGFYGRRSDHSYVTNENVSAWHVREDCPVLKEIGVYQIE